MTSHPNGLKDPRQWLGYIPTTLQHSPLYTHLYTHLQEDPEILPLLALIDTDQPIPILFFSAVNFLVLRDKEHELAQFYPYLCATNLLPVSESYPFFRDFCLTHRDELQHLLPGTRLQTNEVTRCANLLPAFEMVFQRGECKPLNLIEIGASAGLNLNWNLFGYHYETSDRNISEGNFDYPVQVHCLLEGNKQPPIPETFPSVAQCQGIELFPLDIHNEVDVRWLRACIWPEEEERYHSLDTAIAMAQTHPSHLLTGDAGDLLPGLLATVPLDQTLCLWHSFALNQGPARVRESIEQTLLHASHTRTIYRVSEEVDPTRIGLPRLELFTYQNGSCMQQEWLANCTIHGERMEWLLPNVDL